MLHLKIFFFTLLFLNTLFADIITPLPQKAEYDKIKAELGKKLFFDPILSIDNTVSCASCHILPGSGSDLTSYSKGVGGAIGGMNTPTVLNSMYNLSQFWDGRAADLQEQAGGPIVNPVEMASTKEHVLKVLNENKRYKKHFYIIYKEALKFSQVTEVLAEFEKALITPNAPFDNYLRGDTTALTDLEKKGYELFQNKGCISCHNGINIGGSMYQKVGIFEKFIGRKGSLGRYNVTKDEDDRYTFKVPSLRNVALTAPYMHDGNISNLKDMISKMGRLQLGQDIDEKEVDAIVAFLHTLTGQTPEILK